MALTIAQIKKEATDQFMYNETVATAYGFTAGSSFDGVFSKVSLESMLFYIFAVCVWTVEKLMDTHNAEITELIDTKKPHRLKWYRDKALAFRYGRSLLEDSDEYDLTGVDLSESASELVVSYASAIEYAGRLYVKVAGGTSVKAPLPGAQQTALEAYMGEIKDAGVQLQVVNLHADHMRLSIQILYDPMILDASGLRLDNGSDPIRALIRDYIENQMPLNSEYRNASLIDAIQQVDGVVIPTMLQAQAISHDQYTL